MDETERTVDLGSVTLLLKRVRDREPNAENDLLPVIYNILHRLAQAQFRNERAEHTLQPTAIVNELYLRLLRDSPVDWQSRNHLYALAAKTLRRILVDHANSRRADKRPSSQKRVSLDKVFVYSPQRSTDLLDLDMALNALHENDPRQARIVEMHFFTGLTFQEIASVLNVSERTIKREWSFARAWLLAYLRRPEGGQRHVEP